MRVSGSGYTRVAIWLGLFAMVGLGLWFIGEALQLPSGERRPALRSADLWLAEHALEARTYARTLLAEDDAAPVPAELARFDPHRRGETVVFTLHRGGFKEPDHGVCYAPAGEPPPPGLGSSPRDEETFRWIRITGPWWFWEAEFL